MSESMASLIDKMSLSAAQACVTFSSQALQLIQASYASGDLAALTVQASGLSANRQSGTAALSEGTINGVSAAGLAAAYLRENSSGHLPDKVAVRSSAGRTYSTPVRSAQPSRTAHSSSVGFRKTSGTGLGPLCWSA